MTAEITCNVTPEDYAKIKQRYQSSTCRSVSEYTRNILLNKPITLLYRDQSLDDLIEEIVVLNNEINILKNKQQELIEKLDQYPEIQGLRESLKMLEQVTQMFCQRITEIKVQFEKITSKWSQL